MYKDLLAQAKSLGFSDRQIAHLTKRTEDEAVSYTHLTLPTKRIV